MHFPDILRYELQLEVFYRAKADLGNNMTLEGLTKGPTPLFQVATIPSRGGSASGSGQRLLPWIPMQTTCALRLLGIYIEVSVSISSINNLECDKIQSKGH